MYRSCPIRERPAEAAPAREPIRESPVQSAVEVTATARVSIRDLEDGQRVRGVYAVRGRELRRGMAASAASPGSAGASGVWASMFLTKILYGTALQLVCDDPVRKVCNFSGSCFTEHRTNGLRINWSVST